MAKALKENEVELEGKILQIVPIKMKYMKAGYFNTYLTIKSIGFLKLIGKYSDGEKLTKILLTGAFDSEEKANEIYEMLDTPTMMKIMNIIKTMNEIEDEEEIKNVETPQE